MSEPSMVDLAKIDTLASAMVIFCKSQGLSPADTVNVFASAIGATIFASDNEHSPEGLEIIGEVIDLTIERLEAIHGGS